MIRLALSLALTLAPAAAAQPRPDAFTRAWAPVRDYFHATLAAEGVVGGALWFFQGDSVLAREYHGFADLASRRRVDEHTIFHWASITKTLTAVAVLQQRDRGRLSLDDPVLRHVPELRVVHNPFGPMDAITLRQLLSHSAGFRAGTWPWTDGQPWHPFEPTAWSQLVAMLPYTEVLFAPGSRYGYSNPGYVYLGRTLEAITGEEYEVHLEKNVLRPLGMAHSYFDRTPYHLLGHRSDNYVVRGGAPVAQGLDFDTGITVANGGLNAPVGDLVRYLQFLLGVPGTPAAARGVLARASIDEAWRPVVAVGGTPAGNAAIGVLPRDSMGLGFFTIERNGVRLVGHTGSQAAFRAFFYVDPASQAGVVAVMNTVNGDPTTDDAAAPRRPRIATIQTELLERLTREAFRAVQR